ncbi:hypothetical protein N752_26135 [Desulforamulus aquiferis]|nr:hypothetical protein [Desulforamulus aquiferis]RYD02296.1 hypothetical protein N752_26135 [Desulforamulus aquiferis]
MFLRKIVTKKNGREYVYVKLIENYREDGKVKQRVLANLGSIENLSPGRLDYLINSLRKLQNELVPRSNEQNLILPPKGKVTRILEELKRIDFEGFINQLLADNKFRTLVESMIVKSILAAEYSGPIQNVCKQMGLIEASGLDFYKVVKKLGETASREVLNKMPLYLKYKREKNHNPIIVCVFDGVFKGISFDGMIKDVDSMLSYEKDLCLIIAYELNGTALDYEYVEERSQIKSQLDRLLTRIEQHSTNKVVVMDLLKSLDDLKEGCLLAHQVEEVPKQISKELVKEVSIFTTMPGISVQSHINQ